MTNYNQEVDSIVEKAVTEKTFSLEIIDQIKKLKELPKKLEEADERIEILTKENARLTVDNTALVKKADDVVRREKAVAEKEQEQKIIDERNKGIVTRLQDNKDMMTLIFRNTTIRENRFGIVPIADNSGYFQQQSTSSNVDKTAE